jgi:outer membrane protein assembly factor BamB
VTGLLGILLAVLGVSRGDWPMYRSDAARSGYTAQTLASRLAVRWTLDERQPPQPAWPTSERMPYDRAFMPVVARGLLYYGTSSDGRVVAVDAATGRARWTYWTDGPIRLTPAVWQDRLFVASDDGYLYCLGADDGRLQWRVRGGPRADMLLGNDRIISRWPARGGPVVLDDIVYFGAGIWPSEGIFVWALDAKTGRRLWCNDSSGRLDLVQPHPTARAQSGISAQGHLAAEGNDLLVPTGRAVPAALGRAWGEFRYLVLQVNRAEGGSEVTLFDKHFINGGALFDRATGAAEIALGAPVGKKGDPVVHNYTAPVQAAVHPRWVIYASGNQVSALDRTRPVVTRPSVDRKGRRIEVRKRAPAAWIVELPVTRVAALAVARDHVIVGADDRVLMLAAETGATLWEASVRGTVYGLAVAEGRLYASTDQGVLYGFDDSGLPAVEVRPALPAASGAVDPRFAQAAEEILRRTSVADGYVADLGCGDGQLALELARRTKLRIVAVDRDAEQVRRARERLTAAGLYGVRAVVHQADPAVVAYPNYFADLVVSGRSVVEGTGGVAKKAARRMQRPYGGIVCVGRPGAMEQSVRGALEGAADWTHQYADAANTLCSDDLLPRSPLAMLWFRDTDLVMPSRHGRGPAPLVWQGRMFVEGLDALRAVNVYNGTTLWELRLPGLLKDNHQDHLTGVAATGGNCCIGADRLYLRTDGRCLVLDPRSGRRLAEWRPPSVQDRASGPWGYIAYDDGTLFGSVAVTDHVVKESWRNFLGQLDMRGQLSESRMLFAMDATNGRVKWSYPARNAIRHNTIAVGGGRVYCIDRALAEGDRGDRPASGAEPRHCPGRLICLDATTGREVWQSADGFATLLILSAKHDVLLASYQATSFRLDSEAGGRMAAYRASDGTKLWEVPAAYRSRPVVNDRAVYAEPGKWDLLTGQRLPFEFSRSYGCGILAGSQRLLVYRSATLGYRDLVSGQATENYGGIRPGCWVNAIPADGLVLMADAASWCTCSYLIQATVALAPAASD